MDNRPRTLDLIVSLIATVLVLWESLPPDERLWLRLKAATLSRRVLAALARREGRAGMADELAAGPERAASRYNAAYWLSLARDFVAEAVRP